MIALDTNILLHARRRELQYHQEASSLLRDLAEGDDPWALPWPCIYEFVRVVTHPRVFDPPTDLETALEDLESLLDSPSVLLLGEGPVHFAHMARAIESGSARGNLAHDAHIAALAVEHGVIELWTTDKDFARFSELRIRNPLTEPKVHEPRAGYRATRAGRRSARRTVTKR